MGEQKKEGFTLAGTVFCRSNKIEHKACIE